MTIFASGASDVFNLRMLNVLERLARDVSETLGDNLHALILAGGYGRGEGGVVVRDGIECPYNDLDLVLVLRRRGGTPAGLHEISRRYGGELGIDVDFSRPVTLDEIRRWPAWLMWHELAGGHIVLSGPENILRDNVPARVLGPPPATEALRLLLNRGAGLLWARLAAQGIEKPPDPDFIRRNLHKCAMALGDALLIVHGRHATPYSGRDRRVVELLKTLPPLSFDLEGAYAAALRFRFHPDQSPRDGFGDGVLLEMAGHWLEVLLRVESFRTGRDWRSAGEYGSWGGIREKGMNGPQNWPGNIARNLLSGRCSALHPRESLYRALPMEIAAPPGTPGWERRAVEFLTLWRRFN